MDPEEHRQKMCGDKRQYRKKKAAILTLQDMKKHHQVDKNVKPYKCWYCVKWHLGHNRYPGGYNESNAGGFGIGRAGSGSIEASSGNEEW